MKCNLSSWPLVLLRHLAYVVVVAVGCTWLLAWYRGGMEPPWALLRSPVADTPHDVTRPPAVRLEISVPADASFEGHSGGDSFVVSSRTPHQVTVRVKREPAPRSLEASHGSPAVPKW